MALATHCGLTGRFQAMLYVVLVGRERSVTSLANRHVHTASIKTNVTFHFGHQSAIWPVQIAFSVSFLSCYHHLKRLHLLYGEMQKRFCKVNEDGKH